ncbi:MAG: sodium:calcium antiporter [Solirubrobacterales bacterium]
MHDAAILLISLGIILVGAEAFTNAVEWLGKRMNLPEGAVGSILAAVGTALPETMIPLIALTLDRGGNAKSIGIGAILGAPLMLSTLAMFVTGTAIIAFRRRRRAGTDVLADPAVMSRDLSVFLVVFSVAMLAGLIPPQFRFGQLILAGLMVLAYIYYVWLTLQDERCDDEEEDLRACYFAPKADQPAYFSILAQLGFALVMIVGGAHLFVQGVESLAIAFGIPAFVLALVIAPIATELPEKFNSVIWVSREKDTLALGNITGAMVFQSSLIPAMGIFLSDWQLSSGALLSGLLTLTAAGVLFLETHHHKKLQARTLLLSGAFYLLFLILVLKRVIV